MNDRKLGPNDPCHCGSGKKYKKCHQAQDQSASQGAPAPAKTEARRDPLILNEEEREGMRKACAFNASVMDYIRDLVKPGMTTGAIDTLVHDYTVEHGHTPATLGYRGFTKSCCTSVNDVICHGIPGPLVLKDGDIVNVDLTSIVDGWYGDQSETLFIGDVSDLAVAVTQCSFDAMWSAIDALEPGCKVKEIGRAIQKVAKASGFSVVKDFFGHGIGRRFHQRPHVPHFAENRHGSEILRPGMCFTIEPMINTGTWRAVIDESDGWTAYTTDGGLSAQFEHTILMTETGPEVMTLTKHGPQRGHHFTSPASVKA
ncbi:MAG: methionyl aminopeptidase [Planctomycetes bacterium]|nr:methionyl aminopeptidase [Planctomycetota bacterium]MCA8936131.1 methionyl aminopeptidase [Planctomycetota bacterium]MCA8945912.1 methionyl aminopeptidase [Planctomycetota bacterium]